MIRQPYYVYKEPLSEKRSHFIVFMRSIQVRN